MRIEIERGEGEARLGPIALCVSFMEENKKLPNDYEVKFEKEAENGWQFVQG